MNHQHSAHAVAIGLTFIGPSIASASFTTYFDDYSGWTAAAGSSTKLDFVGVENGQTVPFDWYQPLGITLASKFFPDAASWGFLEDPATLDGWSASTATGFSNDVHAVNFHQPVYAFAYEEWNSWGSPVSAAFFLGGQAIGTAPVVPPFFQGGGVHFYGWTSTVPFDRVVLNNGDPIDAMYIVPAPSGALILTLAFARSRSRQTSKSSK